MKPEEIRNKQAVLETSEGTIVLDLLADAAPNHVAHFITQARAGRLRRDGVPPRDCDGHHPGRRSAIEGSGAGGEVRHRRSGQASLRSERREAHAGRRVGGAGARQSRQRAATSSSSLSRINQRSTGSTRSSRASSTASTWRRRSRRRPPTNTVPAARIEIRKVSIRDKPAPEPEPFVSTSVEELSSYRAVLTTSLGDITIELFPDRAPNHVRQFLRLASSGVYDGTSFHRVVKGFVVQTWTSAHAARAADERQQSYVHMLQPEFNPTPHERGIVSMARLDDPASASSSFFIVLGRSPALDNQYTVFGRVIAGMDVLEKIENAPLNGEAPVTRIELTGVRLVRQ